MVIQLVDWLGFWYGNLSRALLKKIIVSYGTYRNILTVKFCYPHKRKIRNGWFIIWRRSTSKWYSIFNGSIIIIILFMYQSVSAKKKVIESCSFVHLKVWTWRIFRYHIKVRDACWKRAPQVFVATIFEQEIFKMRNYSPPALLSCCLSISILYIRLCVGGQVQCLQYLPTLLGSQQLNCRESNSIKSIPVLHPTN